MSRSLVAFLLAAFAAFSSFFFPSEVFAYGTTVGVKADVLCTNSVDGGMPSNNSSCYSFSQALAIDQPYKIRAACGNNTTSCPNDTPITYSSACKEPTATGTFFCNITFGYTVPNSTSKGTNTVQINYFATKRSVYKCDSPLLTTDAGCTCPPGQAPDATGACVPYTCPSSGTVIPGTDGSTFALNGSSADNSFCVSGCLVTSSFVVGFTDSSGQKKNQAVGPIRSTGQTCNPLGQGGTQQSLGAAQPGQAAASAPATCPVGQCPGTVNGVSVCAACSSMTTGSVTTTTGQAGGTITSTDCSGGTCTTKTGTVDSKGNVTWTTSTSGSGQNASNTPAGGNGATGTGSGASQNQDQQSFCAENPDSIICKSSSWGGTCGSFTCSGDAVQCQIAKMQSDMWCGTSQLPDGIQGKYDALTGEGQAPSSFDDKVNLTLPTPEAATCAVQDMQIKFIGGVALNVPLSQMCQWLGYIHTIVVSFGVLMWVFIVFRGK